MLCNFHKGVLGNSFKKSYQNQTQKTEIHIFAP